jgi:hypothetical protein
MSFADEPLVIIDKDGNRRSLRRVRRGEDGSYIIKQRDGALSKEMNMTLSNEALLRVVKARSDPLLSGTDLSDDGSSVLGRLGVEQTKAFLQLLSAGSAMLQDVRRVTSGYAKWAETKIESGGRMLRPGVEATVGATVKPSLGTVEMDTGFFKAIVPVGDEFFEDSLATDADQSIANIIADQVGADVLDACLNSKDSDSDFNDGDVFYDVLPAGGWLAQVEADGNVYDASGDGQDYQTMFRQALIALPIRALRGMVTDGRFYVPVVLEQKYRDALSARGTNLGDVTLQGTAPLSYQGISIMSVPAFYVAAGSPDKSHILLAKRQNLIWGVQRDIRIETWRDPREGAKSWIVTTRFDAKVEVPEFATFVHGVSVEP